MTPRSPIEQVRRTGKVALVAISGCLIIWLVATIVIIAWRIGARPASSTGELASQGDLLLGAVTYPVTLALAITTGWYTWTTSHILRETRRTNDLHEAEAKAHQERQRLEDVRAHAANLIAATAALLRHSSEYQQLQSWRARWSIRRIRDRWFMAAANMNRALGEAHVAATRTRMLGFVELTKAVDEHLAVLEKLHHDAVQRGDITTTIRELAQTQEALEQLATASGEQGAFPSRHDVSDLHAGPVARTRRTAAG